MTTFLYRRVPEGDCDCGILKDIVEGLDKVINANKDDEDNQIVEAGDEPAETETPAEGEEGK